MGGFGRSARSPLTVCLRHLGIASSFKAPHSLLQLSFHTGNRSPHLTKQPLETVDLLLLNFARVQSSQLCRERVHCVLLIVQPPECADDAGFTPVQSHVALLALAPSQTQTHTHTHFFFFFYILLKVWQLKLVGTTAAASRSRAPIQECSHASNQRISPAESRRSGSQVR